MLRAEPYSLVLTLMPIANPKPTGCEHVENRYDWEYLRACQVLDPSTVTGGVERGEWLRMVNTIIDTVPALSRLAEPTKVLMRLQAARVHQVGVSLSVPCDLTDSQRWST